MIDQLEQQLHKLTYGDHLCPVIESEEEQTQQISQFIIKGLSQNNRCIYISNQSVAKKIREVLASSDIYSHYEEKGVLLFKTPEEIYLKTGTFDKREMITWIDKTEEEAIKSGYEGIWLADDKEWFMNSNADTRDVIEYEALCNEIFSQRKIVLFCQYHHTDDIGLIGDLIATHPLIIINHFILENPLSHNKELLLALAASKESLSPEIKQKLGEWRLERLKSILTIELEKSHLRKEKEEMDVRFRQLIENINEVFWLLDLKQNKVLYISPNFEKIWGFKINEVIADPYIWINAIHPHDRERIKMRFLQKNYDNSDEKYRIILADKKTHWVRERTFLVRDNDNQEPRAVGIIEDITTIHNLEEQYYHSQKFEAIGKLAGGVAHDFNNLLAIILSNADLLLSKPLEAEQKEFAHDIKQASLRASNLTKQLLLFGRQKELTITQFNVNEEIDMTTKMLKPLLGENIQLQQKLTDYPAIINADKSMINQILVNLTINARDAMPNGGRLLIETSIVKFNEATTINSPETRPGVFVCLSVSDTGVGIPSNILAKIFDPFFTTKDVGKGSGLGLATVHSLVEQHQGWTHVYSEVGIGTIMKVYLPLVKSEGKDVLQSQEEEILPFKEATILIIEDEESLRHVIKKILTNAGYHVLEAMDGKSAIDTWEKHKDSLDLILTDLVLPNKMGGKAIAEYILQRNSQQKFIFMSGYSKEFSQNIDLHEGKNYIIKPFESKALINLVRRNLS